MLRGLANTDVPVPSVLLYHEDPGLIGTSFYVMDRLEGRVLHDGALPGLGSADRRAIYMAMAETLARLHRIVPAAVGLAEFGRAGNYFRRQIERWSAQWRASPLFDTMPELDRVAAWLGDNVPAEAGPVSIVHGDFRLGNLMLAPAEPRIVGVLDWELSTLGHPLADLGFCCLAWHLGPDEYRGIRGLDLDALGLPSQAEFIARYAALAPGTGPLQTFHLVFALFRFAVIFVGIADRARAGTAVAENAASIGPLARNFTARAQDLIDAGPLA